MKLPMADFIPKNHRTVLQTAAWASKILFLLIGIASTAVLMARFAFPYLHSLLSSSLPKLWNSAVSWLAPPYLFITVHFIIMIIWKLHRNPIPEDVVSNENSSVDDTKSIGHVNLDEPEISIERHSESDPDSYQIHAIIEDTVGSERSTERRPWPPPEADPEEIKEDTDYLPSSGPDSIDATWQAIMDSKSSPVKNQLKKSDTWEKTSHVQAKPNPPALTRAVAVENQEFKKSDAFRESTVAVEKKEMRKSKTFRETTTTAANTNAGWRGRDVLVVGSDELFRKVEAFIKMNYDQMRLQRQESEQHRRVEMVNAAY